MASWAVLTVAFALVAVEVAPAGAQSSSAASRDDAAVRSAQSLLQRCLTATRDGKHNTLLRSLRHLRDPRLAPLFAQLARSDNISLRIHGLLGLAETDPDQAIDLKRMAGMDDPVVLAAAVSAAIDNDLLSLDESQRLLAERDDLPPAVRALVAAPLVGAGRYDDLDTLREMADKPDSAAGRRALARLMLVQLGEAPPESLDDLGVKRRFQLDQLREMMLDTALRYDYERVAPWASRIAADPAAGARLRLLALEAAIAFSEPSAQAAWRRWYGQTDSVAQRTRLALLAFKQAESLPPAFFDPLARESNPLLARIGAAGRAIAAGEDLPRHLTRLIELNHPITNRAVLRYASDQADAETAPVLLIALVLAFDPEPERGVAARLDTAVAAAERLVEAHPRTGSSFLRSQLNRDDAEPLLVKGVLLGLMRARGTELHRIIETAPPRADGETRALVALVRARQGQPLTPAQREDLSLLVRGGLSFDDAIRLQGAWFYLVSTGQIDPVLDKVLSY